MIATLGWVFFAASLQFTPVPVHHSRPSELLGRMRETLPNLEIQADDDRGLLLARGAAEDVEELKVYANLFDVQPKRVRLKLDIESEIDGRQAKVELMATNLSLVKWSDQAMRMETEFTPRINDDATITFRLKVRYNGRWGDVQLRLRHGTKGAVYFSRKGQFLRTDPAPPAPTGYRALPKIGLEVLIDE